MKLQVQNNKIKVRKSKAKKNYFDANGIDYEVEGNYIYIDDLSLMQELAKVDVSQSAGANVSKKFTLASKILYSSVLKKELSFDSSKELAKDIEAKIVDYIGKDKFKSVKTEVEARSQKLAGIKASITRKLNDLAEPKADMSALVDYLGQKRVEKLDKDLTNYIAGNDSLGTISDYVENK